MKTSFSSLLFLAAACAASAVQNVTMEADNRQLVLHFSGAPSRTPLIIHFGEPVAAADSDFAVQHEGKTYKIGYIPHPGEGTATLTINSDKIFARALLSFRQDNAGTAEMTWTENGAETLFRDIRFSLAEASANPGTIVLPKTKGGLTLPGGLENKCLQIKLEGITKGKPGSKGAVATYTPLVVCFPEREGNSFTVNPQGNISTPVNVSYSPFTSGDPGASVELETGKSTYIATLHFEQAGTDGTYSGKAELIKRGDGSVTQLRGGAFTIRPVQQGDVALALPLEKGGNPPAVPAELCGRKIQFSYSPSWKHTPLLMRFGGKSTGAAQVYTLKGENSSCKVTYTPDAASGKAAMSVVGERDKADIRMKFVTSECGTAEMTWNGADYYHLVFRLSENPSLLSSFCRMGDPVGDVLPVSLDGQVLEVDFSAALECREDGSNSRIPWVENLSAPMVVQFPAGNDSSIGMQDSAKVCYERRGSGAVVTLRNDDGYTEISLDFETPDSGLAHVEWVENGIQRLAAAARFRLRSVNNEEAREQSPAQKPFHPAPLSLDGKLVVLNFATAEESRTERGEQPEVWNKLAASPMALQFPVQGNNTYSYQLYESTPDSPWPPVKVTYDPAEGCIHITGNDMHVRVGLSFHSATKGTASIEWHDEGGSWYVRHADFVVTPSTSTAGLVTMPQAEERDGAIQSVDDGLGELVRELEKRKYKTAVERLYQKRLLTVLPQIMEGAPIDNIIPHANGTTALHNACGLSHVEIVRWLVEHGADINAKTAKGASVETCVGGPNAKAIRAILKNARNCQK